MTEQTKSVMSSGTAHGFPARDRLLASTTASQGYATRASRAQSVGSSRDSTCVTSTSRHSSNSLNPKP
jgi:hypothetical protein